MWKYPVFLLSLLVGLGSCDSSSSLAPAARGDPAFNWMNNPDNGNVRIMRFEDVFIVCWSDDENGLRACHSTIPLGDGTETDCGPQDVLDPVENQFVGLIDEIDFFASWLHANAKGRVWITVRDLTQPGDCFDNLLVAEGWGRAHYVDNDLFGVGEGDKNANAWGFRAQGKLTTPDGGTLVYNGHFHGVFNRASDLKEFGKVSVH